MKPTGAELAKVAMSMLGKAITYEEMDCQGFVENCLKQLGIKKNWRGSNHMWREALSWKGTPEECMETFGCIPVGAWVFTLKNDGGEKARGYNDNEGNAAHVGIYTGEGKGTVHSSTGGVQEGAYPAARWNRIGLPSCLSFKHTEDKTVRQVMLEGLERMRSVITELEKELM